MLKLIIQLLSLLSVYFQSLVQDVKSYLSSNGIQQRQTLAISNVAGVTFAYLLYYIFRLNSFWGMEGSKEKVDNTQEPNLTSKVD